LAGPFNLNIQGSSLYPFLELGLKKKKRAGSLYVTSPTEIEFEEKN